MDYILNKNGTQIMIETKALDLKKQIAEQYKTVRVGKRISQEKAASAAGMARPDVSRFESGKYNPSLELMIRYAEALGCDLKVELVPRKE